MQNSSHDLGFISCQGSQCGLSSCSRNTLHYHCRLCGFGTSQVSNAMAHGRLCISLDTTQKDFTSLPACSDGSLYSPSTQPYTYYPQSGQNSVANSKMIAGQQPGMFNFVIPTQNPQFGSIYGPQTVFPNSNLFSPSGFNNFAQLDSSWIQQSRLLPTNAMSSNSPQADNFGRGINSTNCCRENTAHLGLTSPLAMDTCKGGKDSQSQNWYCNTQSTFNQQKYPDSTASSCSISLLFLDQSKESDECINVDDLCFDPKSKIQQRSSCMQEDKKDDSSSSTSESSDIVVEESDSESSDNNYEMDLRCLVCEIAPNINRFTPLTEKTPLTTSSQTSVFNKLSNILEQKHCIKTVICGRCLDLTNLIDSLEVKLSSAINELKYIFKTGKERVQIKECEVTAVDESFVCQICVKPFSSAAHLAKHKQLHSKSFSYYCEYCGKGFAYLQKLENHVQLHSKTLRFQCELCGKQFLEKHTLTNHIRQHKGEYRYHCSICKKGFVQKSVYKIHVDSHNGQFFICHHCGKKIKSHSNLMVHIKICTGDLKHGCSKCKKKFPLQSLLERHISLKHKLKFTFTCSHCQKGFVKESDLISHARTHSKDKPYRCLKCNKCYKSKKNLNHHMKLHGSDANLSCNICGKDFTRADALTDHLNQHTGRKPYECQVCWKRFANRINFSVHVKRHREKETVCPICKKVVIKSLKEHMQIHSGKKTFSCKQCSAVFSFKNSMVKHVKSKHGVFKGNEIP